MKSYTHKIAILGLGVCAVSLPVSFVPVEFGIGLAVIGWLGEGIVNRRWLVAWHPVFIPLCIYIVWNIIASAVSARPSHSLLALADNEWPLILMLMIYWLVPSERTLRQLVKGFLIVSAVGMVYGIWQSFSGYEIYRGRELAPMGGMFRAVGFYGFYLTFAAFAMSAFTLSLSLALEHGSRVRLLFLAVTVLSFLAIIGSFARSVWVAVVVIIPIIASFHTKAFWRVLLACVGASIVLAGTFEPAILQRALSVFDLQDNQTRLNLWKTSFRMVADFPVTGIGQDNFDHYFQTYRVEGYYDTIVHPHSDYLTVLVSSGFPGLLAFIATWMVVIGAGYKGWRTAKQSWLRGIIMGGTAAIVGFLVGGFFQNYYGTFANCLGWWFVTGLVLCATKFTESHDPGRSRP